MALDRFHQAKNIPAGVTESVDVAVSNTAAARRGGSNPPPGTKSHHVVLVFAQMNSTLCLDDFDYDLPLELIAQVPLAQRSASRLLAVAGSQFSDHAFTDLPSFLRVGDLLVINDTRV